MQKQQQSSSNARVWNKATQSLVPQTPQQEAIIAAVQHYFTQSATTVDTASLTHIDILLQKQHTSCIDTEHLLTVQTANSLLDMEGKAMSQICAAQGSPFVCQKGCCGCCHQLVLCSPLETALMVAYLQDHTLAREHFLRTWPLWQAQAESISTSYIAWGRAFYGEGKDDGSHTRHDYSIPCPFLDNAGACVLYVVRPHACRSSVAVDTRCVDGHTEAIGGKHNMLFSLYTGHHKARQHLFQTLCPVNDTTQILPMPTTVWHAFKGS